MKKNLNNKNKLYLIVIFMLSMVMSLFSQDQILFTVGVEDYENFLPYSSYINGEYSGLGREILDLYCESRGYIFQYKAYPLKRRDSLYLTGEFDFIFPDNPNWRTDVKGDTQISYAPILPYIDGVIVKEGRKEREIDKLKVLGVPIGFTPWPYLNKIIDDDILPVTINTYDSLLKMVDMDRIDGAFVNIVIARYYGLEFHNLVFDPELPYSKGHWYISSISHPEIISDFQSFTIDYNEEIEKLKQKYNFNNISAISE